MTPVDQHNLSAFIFRKQRIANNRFPVTRELNLNNIHSIPSPIFRRKVFRTRKPQDNEQDEGSFFSVISVTSKHLPLFNRNGRENRGHEYSLVSTPARALHTFQLGKPHLIFLVQCLWAMPIIDDFNFHSQDLPGIYYSAYNLFSRNNIY